MKDKASAIIAREIEYRRSRVNTAEKNAQEINVDLIAEAFPQGYWQLGVFLELQFCLPFVFDLIENFKEFMNIQYPDRRMMYETRHIWESSAEAGHFLHYDGFEVSFRTSREGTTCVLSKIGEETKVVPIFEVVCADGANEAV